MTAIAPVQNHKVACGGGMTVFVLNRCGKRLGATSIEAEIIFGANELGLNVRDGGSGVSQDILQHGGVDKHYGLLGMKERAEQIGARFSIFSRAGAGTEIEVRVPSKVAYCSARRSVNGLLTKLMKHTDTKS